MCLLELTLGELGLFIEGIDDLAEELVFDDTPLPSVLHVRLRVLKERVEPLIFRLVGGRGGRLAQIAKNVELEEAFKKR